MKRILLVDDSPTSRNLLATVLETAGYGIVQASSGEEGLRRADEDDPDLIITDIVMPGMDGFELVSRLCADPARPKVPIIFYTGVKHEHEARALARSCGVNHLITKPGDPAQILTAVTGALSVPNAPEGTVPSVHFDVQRLLTNELTDVMADRESTYMRIAGLIEIGRVLTQHRDPQGLLHKFCEMARDVMQARVAAVGIRSLDQASAQLVTVGVDPDTRANLHVEPRSGVLRRLLDFDGAVRTQGLDAEPSGLGLPDTHPYLTAFLGVPIVAADAILGWFYVGHTTARAAFTEDDERLAMTLARQLAVAYDNARLYSQLRAGFTRVQSEVEVRRTAEAELKARVRQLGALEQLSERALAGAEWAHLLREAATRLRQALDADCATIFELQPDGEHLALTAFSARHGEQLPGDPLVVPLDATSSEALHNVEPEILNGRESPPLATIPAVVALEAQASIRAAIQGRPQPCGIIEVYRREKTSFTERDSQFVQSVANLLASYAERKRTEEQLISSHAQLRELASRLQSVREDERTHIAREIHDELGQSLTALKMELAFLGRSLNREGIEHMNAQIRSMNTLIEQTIQQVRKLSTELRPGVLDHLGLVAAVEWQAGEFANRTGIECEVSAELDDEGLSDERCTAVFRILQETLTNVARHANATHVSVQLRQEDGHLVLQVQDNGKGFDNEGVRFTSLGLLGMRERALLLGGELYIGSVPGKGSKIAVKIPFRKDDSGNDT